MAQRPTVRRNGSNPNPILEQRSIKDDALEAILKGATNATSNILASILVRRLFKS
ncbi:MAG: hypothetical protein M3151_07000 [Actinomycetota bacterium]|nr:hypothetical protein [Actinomycetota bacterium]